MRPFTLGTVFLYLITIAYQEPIEKLENVLVYPVEPATKKSKRDNEDNKQSDINRFIEEKLVQHTQALEYVVKLLHKNEEVSQHLVDALSQKVVEPKLPEEIEVQQNSRRSGVESDDENPISRRSFGSKPVFVPNSQRDNKISPWCSVAILCRRSMNPVCGYDDNFGYGKFDDVCHMLQVNCYWKYNFALVPSCKPVIQKLV